MGQIRSRNELNIEGSKGLVALIDHHRMASFPGMLERNLQQLCKFDTFMMAVYKGTSRPLLVHPTNPENKSDTLHRYIEKAYVLDPLFHAIREGAQPGVTRLANIMPDSFESTEYYRTCYREFGLEDEIDLIVRLEDDVTCAVAIGRRSALGPITRLELNALQNFYPVLAALLRQFWLSRASDYTRRHEPGDLMATALGTFASNVLTPREQEITGLILRGFSSRAIAKKLNISTGTVKVHRKNIHARLGTSSQPEVFVRFIAHLNSLVA